ncbi:Essential protein Yae1, N terminal [Xylographa vitiligo]|nr:Essential protein Yae1, N terminal [Xylographa vitiligo]
MLISTPPHTFPLPLPLPLVTTTPPLPSPPPQSDLLSDIFSSSPSPPRSPHPHNPDLHHTTHPSDIPRLRSQHSTAGYRDGLSASKTPTLQPGFDEGYTLGAVLGLKTGELLGILDGLCAALKSGHRTRPSGAGSAVDSRPSERAAEIYSAAAADHAAAYERLTHLRRRATTELAPQRVFAAEFWGPDGVWSWGVVPAAPPAEAGERSEGFESAAVGGAGEDVTFEEVAAAHPLVREWAARVEGVMREWGVRRGVWAGEEWEAGRGA